MESNVDFSNDWEDIVEFILPKKHVAFAIQTQLISSQVATIAFVKIVSKHGYSQITVVRAVDHKQLI